LLHVVTKLDFGLLQFFGVSYFSSPRWNVAWLETPYTSGGPTKRNQELKDLEIEQAS
jgi:hypothetical protein